MPLLMAQNLNWKMLPIISFTPGQRGFYFKPER
jgi:hypothetical protein